MRHFSFDQIIFKKETFSKTFKSAPLPETSPTGSLSGLWEVSNVPILPAKFWPYHVSLLSITTVVTSVKTTIRISFVKFDVSQGGGIGIPEKRPKIDK